MMLKQEDLLEAAQEAEKGAQRCTRFCRITVAVEDGRYLCAHNGIGNRDTDAQSVRADATLNLNKEQLAERLKTWVAGLHTGIRVDLNAMATEYVLVGSSGPEVFVSGLTTNTITVVTSNPRWHSWPWRWTDGRPA